MPPDGRCSVGATTRLDAATRPPAPPALFVAFGREHHRGQRAAWRLSHRCAMAPALVAAAERNEGDAVIGAEDCCQIA